MRKIAICFLLLLSLIGCKKKVKEPEFIEFQFQSPQYPDDISERDQPRVVISAVKVNMPLIEADSIMISGMRKNHTQTISEIKQWTELMLHFRYHQFLTSRESYRELQGFILRNKKFLVDSFSAPSCMITMNTEKYYLRPKDTSQFFSDLKNDLSGRNYDITIVKKIEKDMIDMTNGAHHP